MADSETQQLVFALSFVGMFALVGLGLIAWGWRWTRLAHEERRQMIDKGITPPPASLQGWPAVRQRELQLRHEERRLMIEKGLLPPVETGRWERDDFLRRGLVTLGFGLALGITYVLLPAASEWRPWLAFISPGLALFGAACLAYVGLTRDAKPQT